MTRRGDPMEARLAERLRLLLLRREHRLGRALARAELARRISVSKSSLYAYLKGTTVPRADVFDRLLVELDAEPAEMRELSTLRDAIEVAQHREPRRAGTLPVPRQLPPATGRFAGRAAELERLAGLLAAAGPGAARIAAIDGTAGVGKTTLALHWAHRVRRRYPDGQLHVNLRGFDPRGPVDPGEVLHGFLQASASRPSRSRTGWTPRPRSTGVCWPTGGCWSSWTTPLGRGRPPAAARRPVLPGGRDQQGPAGQPGRPGGRAPRDAGRAAARRGAAPAGTLARRGRVAGERAAAAGWRHCARGCRSR